MTTLFLAILIGNRVDEQVVLHLRGLELNGGINTAPEFAIFVILGLYFVAAILNCYIPKLSIEHTLANRTPGFLLADFCRCFLLLWKGPLGQVSLATSLFWGAGTSLRFIILAWAAVALKLNLEQATQLTAVVAVGLAIGSVVAAKTVPLEHAVKILQSGAGFATPLLTFPRCLRSKMVTPKRFGQGNMPRPAWLTS